MIYLHIVSERLMSINCLNNTERLLKSDAETRGSFHACSQFACTLKLMSVAASFGSDFARLSLDQVLTVPALFSPQRESYVLLSPVLGLSATGRR